MSVVTSKIALLKTQEYFNKISSVSSGTKDKESVFKFVEGIHDLGLWDSMVCWPLRSAQNAGTGSTAYSLGGLGTYNGTLINGPTWGVDGVTFASASSQRIETIDVSTLSSELNSGIATISNIHGQASTGQFIFGNRPVFGVNGRGLGIGADFTPQVRLRSSASKTSIGTVLTLSTSSGFNYYSIFSDGVNNQGRRNAESAGSLGVAMTGTTISGENSILSVAANPIPNTLLYEYYATGTVSLAMFLRSSTSNDSVIYNLAKSTLGQGLGLA
jgi:hypothetical protein